MSHFRVLVILRPNDEPEADALARLLAPFNENTQVDPYLTPCYCKGQAARQRARLAAEVQCGSFEALRETNAKEDKETGRTIQESMQAWQARVAPLLALEKEAEAADPGKDDAELGCEDCQGKGERLSTYNPKSKWDWWCVGGRWSGSLSGADPTKDPRNFKKCWLCDGTGHRNDRLGQATRAIDPAYSCNGCEGTGKMRKHPSEWVSVPDGDRATVETVLTGIEAGKIQLPYALLTPDGAWQEAEARDPSAWGVEVQTTLRKYPAHRVVSIDCHI